MEKAMMEKGLKANAKKMKAFCTGERTVSIETSTFPYLFCRRGVGSKSILCIKCNSWVHKKCSEKQKCSSKVVNFVCRNMTRMFWFNRQLSCRGHTFPALCPHCTARFLLATARHCKFFLSIALCPHCTGNFRHKSIKIRREVEYKNII